MFERAVFRRSDRKPGSSFDIGQLAEMLLFYGHVDLLLDTGSFQQLLSIVGPEATIRLMKLPKVTPVLVTDRLGVMTTNAGFDFHKIISVSLSGSKKNTIKSKEDHIRHIFRQAIGEGWRTKKQADFVSQYFSTRAEGEELTGPRIGESAIKYLSPKKKFAADAVRLILEDRIPNVQLPSKFRFELVEYNDSFIVDTDLNISQLATDYQKYWPKDHGSLSVAVLLAEMLDARASVGLSASFEADIFSTSTAAKINMLLIENTHSTVSPLTGEIPVFSEWFLEGRSIGDALVTGRRTFNDFLDLVEKSEDFRKWVSGVANDENLAKEYSKAINSLSWLDKLPSRVMRYAAFTGASAVIGLGTSPLVGFLTEAALAAADTFLLDKLVRGWKPNQFVDGKVLPFVK
jgi:hypothetical protein